MRELYFLIKRGPESLLPILKEGEFGLTTDTRRLFLGTGTGNMEITNSSQLITELEETVSILNARIDTEVSTINSRIDTEVSTLDTKIDTEVADLTTIINNNNSAQTQALADHKVEANAHDVSKITNAVATSDPRLTDSRPPTAHTQDFSTITNTPTTASGYGITNVYTKTESDTSLSTKLSLTGGTMTGAIVLPGDPTTNLQSSTKGYVDDTSLLNALIYGGA